jgi:lipoprotein-anchoring transpeptidase ErfK/SrfK
LGKLAGASPSVSDHPAFNHHHFSSLRTALVSGVALACLAVLTDPAHAAAVRPGADTTILTPPAVQPTAKMRLARRGDARRERAEPKKDTGFGEMPKGPLQITVNIATQRVTLYSNGERVAQGPVATGMPGHPTPQGVFSIIQKDRYHHSNIYSGAPMPYMQRITWSGVAMHEGALPGYPASHGCIRLSHDFAAKLWPITQLGVRVIVSRHAVEPVEFKHAKLFVPKPKPAEPAVATNVTTNGANIRLAQSTPDAVNDATTPVETVKPAETQTGIMAPAATPTPTTDDTPTATVVETPAELRKAVETPADPPKPAEIKPAEIKPAQVTPAAAPTPAPKATPADYNKPDPTVDPAKPPVLRPKAADQPAKRAGQVAVFVSRKEKKIFVRQGMVPLFDMPITIDNPNQPLGTHVFTAMTVTDGGTGMRWNLMTIPTDPVATTEDRGGGRRHGKGKEPPKPVVQVLNKPSMTATEALDRIQLPQEAVDRISEILIPGSSLVVSDTGISGETGKGTDFIVLTR